ncbi:MAG: AbrB/MazE/SpoVT family DNA-binding domain-containing protein [Candidatus Saccharimonadales bacterium]|jgi:AbrB family looped-hinge helix DNA binding protein
MGFHKDNLQLAGTVTVGPKGQVVVPVEVREQMGIVAGDKLIALYMPETHAIGFVTEESMQTIIDHMGSHVDALRNKFNKKG